jgi:hypothetical protein
MIYVKLHTIISITFHDILACVKMLCNTDSSKIVFTSACTNASPGYLLTFTGQHERQVMLTE